MSLAASGALMHNGVFFLFVCFFVLFLSCPTSKEGDNSILFISLNFRTVRRSKSLYLVNCLKLLFMSEVKMKRNNSFKHLI